MKPQTITKHKLSFNRSEQLALKLLPLEGVIIVNYKVIIIQELVVED